MTQLEIYNLALRHLGQNRVTSTSGSDPATLALNTFWEPCYVSMFEEHAWPFAVVQEELVEASEDVPLGWTFAYDYPTQNVATVWNVFNEGTLDDRDAQDFEIKRDLTTDQKLVCTDLDEAYAEYTKIVTDPEEWPTKFSITLSYFLAASICAAVTGDVDKGIKLMQVYGALMHEAKRIGDSNARRKGKIASEYQNSR